MKIYNENSGFYEKLVNAVGKDYVKEASIVHKIISKYSPESKKILDLGCGTGEHALKLIKFGYDVNCADLSQNMLNSARKKAKVNCYQLDMRNFSLNKKFDVITCMFNTIMYNPNKKDLTNTFTCCIKHLYHKGILILEFTNPELLKQSKPYSNTWQIDKNHKITQTTFVNKSNFINQFKIININSGKIITDTHNLKIFTSDIIIKELKTVGFNDIKTIKDGVSCYIIAIFN